jgi:hypothetical protein
VKYIEVKTGCNQAESSKEGYDSKRVVLEMMMIIQGSMRREIVKSGE